MVTNIYFLGDFEQPDKKFGGYVGVGDIQYFVYAGKAVSSTSSSKAAVPSRSPAPPPKGPPSAPPNSPPKPNPWVDEVCNDLFLSESAPYRKFDRHEMYNFINKTCASPPPDDNRHLNAFSITNNGELTMDLKSTGRSMKRPWDAECIQGFTAIVDNCKYTSLLYHLSSSPFIPRVPNTPAKTTGQVTEIWIRNTAATSSSNKPDLTSPLAKPTQTPRNAIAHLKLETLSNVQTW